MFLINSPNCILESNIKRYRIIDFCFPIVSEIQSIWAFSPSKKQISQCSLNQLVLYVQVVPMRIFDEWVWGTSFRKFFRRWKEIYTRNYKSRFSLHCRQEQNLYTVTENYIETKTTYHKNEKPGSYDEASQKKSIMSSKENEDVFKPFRVCQIRSICHWPSLLTEITLFVNNIAYPKQLNAVGATGWNTI